MYDIDRTCAIDLEKNGAVCADSILEAARASDTVITCLPSPEAVDAVVGGEGGVLANLAPGGTWIDMSTNDAHELQRLAASPRRAASRAESPVTGGVHRAAAGMITVLVGGDEAVYEQATWRLRRHGRRGFFYVGGRARRRSSR